MDYRQTYALVRNEDFRARVQVAAFLAATDIINEPGFDPNGRRGTLALQATRLDEPAVDRFAWACALNPTVAAAEAAEPGSSSDDDLRFVVTSEWDRVAGVA